MIMLTNLLVHRCQFEKKEVQNEEITIDQGTHTLGPGYFWEKGLDNGDWILGILQLSSVKAGWSTELVRIPFIRSKIAMTFMTLRLYLTIFRPHQQLCQGHFFSILELPRAQSLNNYIFRLSSLKVRQQKNFYRGLQP